MREIDLIFNLKGIITWVAVLVLVVRKYYHTCLLTLKQAQDETLVH